MRRKDVPASFVKRTTCLKLMMRSTSLGLQTGQTAAKGPGFRRVSYWSRSKASYHVDMRSEGHVRRLEKSTSQYQKREQPLKFWLRESRHMSRSR